MLNTEMVSRLYEVSDVVSSGISGGTVSGKTHTHVALQSFLLPLEGFYCF